MPGSLLEILSETPKGGGGFDPPIQVGKVNGSAAAQAVGINPPFIEGARVTARYQLCADVSPLSAPQIVQPPPVMTPPTIETPVYEGAKHVIVQGVINGAVIEVTSNGAPVGGQASSGGGQVVGINPPAVAGAALAAKQTLCDSSLPSPDVPVEPCSALPAAEIEPPAAGDEQIHVKKSVLGSRILIFADGEEVGDGGGPLIQLTRPLRPGEVVVVLQQLGDCVSSWIYEIPVECKVTHELSDPSGSGPFEVGVLDYQLPAIPIGSDNVRLWATVRYPAVAAGKDAALIPAPKRLPLVAFLHGNHGIFREGGEDVCSAPSGTPEVPNHAGYDFALESLARGGFIAISINANDLNCKSGRIFERGELHPQAPRAVEEAR